MNAGTSKFLFVRSLKTSRAGRTIVHAMALAVLLCAKPVFSEGVAFSTDDLADLSLEDLLAIQVTSASKKNQRLADTASAVYVISQDDIRRSGASSIPEILRMAPGIEVARIGSNKWAVTSRGFNGRFANKLLVLVDGRSVYTALFSGVWWEELDTMIEDIDRIEVIRGPGAALWGSNAVNGVINIITKNARDTQGRLLAVNVGDKDRAIVSFRQGGKTEDGTYYRAYGKVADHRPALFANGDDALDGWRQHQAGFRIDKRQGDDRVTFQGDTFSSRGGDSPVPFPYFHLQQQNTGANLVGRWERSLADNSNFVFQAYYDFTRYSYYDLLDSRDTLDLDFQHQVAIGSGQDLVWGMSYRLSRDEFVAIPHLKVNPPVLHSGLFSVFIQDDVTLSPDRWRLTLGTKVENNGYTGMEIQPNVRILWTPDSTTTWWGAVSRAVRIPSRMEHDSDNTRTDSKTHFTETLGSVGFGPETLLAWELGLRKQLSPRLSLDVAAFYNHYSGLASYTRLTDPSPSLSVYQLVGQGTANVGGLELATEWNVTRDWRLQAAYTWQRISDSIPVTTADGPYPERSGTSPRSHFSIRSGHALGATTRADLWLRHVGQLPAIGIPAYTELDARLSWTVSRELELSLVGQNLLHAYHAEYKSDLISTAPTLVPRSYFARLVWKF